MSNSKTISDFERELGFMFKDSKKYPEDKKISREEIVKIMSESVDDIVGCNHEVRERYLRSKEIEITRENMIDSTL